MLDEDMRSLDADALGDESESDFSFNRNAYDDYDFVDDDSTFEIPKKTVATVKQKVKDIECKIQNKFKALEQPLLVADQETPTAASPLPRAFPLCPLP